MRTLILRVCILVDAVHTIGFPGLRLSHAYVDIVASCFRRRQNETTVRRLECTSIKCSSVEAGDAMYGIKRNVPGRPCEPELSRTSSLQSRPTEHDVQYPLHAVLTSNQSQLNVCTRVMDLLRSEKVHAASAPSPTDRPIDAVVDLEWCGVDT